MCTIHVQQNIGLQQQLLKASQKIARLEKELEKINERWSNAFSICNTSDPKGMYIADWSACVVLADGSSEKVIMQSRSVAAVNTSLQRLLRLTVKTF